MTPSANIQECPECSASITADKRFVVWCQECEWNLHRSQMPSQIQKAARPGPLARFRRRLDSRFAADLHRQVLGSGLGAPSRDRGRLAAYALATVVHLFALSSLVGGAWLLATTWPSPFGIVFGLAGIGFGYLARPRLGRVRDDAPTLTRQEAPALYDLLDRVAQEVGAPPVDVVVVDGAVNASFGTVGPRRTHVLTIGLPLWLTLEPQERVALLAHEMGHSSNGDSRRMVYVGSAVTTLYEIRHAAVHMRVGGGIRSIITAIGVNIFTGIVRGLVTGVIMVLEALTYRESQRAEYAADDRAAMVASPVAVAGLMDKLITRAPAARKHLKSAAHRSGDLWEGLREYLAGFPELEEERLRRLAQLERVRVDETHPPTHLRKAFAVSRTYGAAKIVTSDDEMKRIQGELDTAGDRIAREITDQARAALYQ